MIIAIGNPVYDEIILPRARTDGRVLSGCSTNAALAIAKLGGRAEMWGCIGADRLESARRDLASYGVSARLFPGRETGGFHLHYPPDGSERTLTVLGRADPIRMPPDRDAADALAAARCVMIGPILGEVDADLVRAVRSAARCPMFLDPQGMLRAFDEAGHVTGRVQEGLLDVLPLFDVVKPNEHEATLLTGIDATREPEAAARRLYSMGARIAVVTLAERGSVVFDGRRAEHIRAFAVDAIDPTGAGDTYGAGFVFEWLRSGDPFRAGRFGSATASVMVENVGPSFPLTLAEALRRFETL